MGKLEAIWIKRVRRGKMDPVSQAELIADRGIVGNANQGGRRQVTIISPSTRRANLMVSGVPLVKTRGSLLRIGDCTLEVMGETKPCERMEEALPGLRAEMYPEWRGGVFARVVEGGIIHTGDEVCIQELQRQLGI